MGSRLSIDSGLTRTGTPFTYNTVTSSGPISKGIPRPAAAIWLGSRLSIDSGLTKTGTPLTYRVIDSSGGTTSLYYTTEISSGPISRGIPNPAAAI